MGNAELIQNLPINVNEDELIAEKCKRSYFYFLQEFWNELVNDPPRWNWHIPYLCGELTQLLQDVADRKKKRYDLIVNVPPGTTKTLICSVFLPAWAWSRGWWWMRFIKASYADSLSVEHGEATKSIVESEKYKRYFPNIKIRQGSKAKSHYKIVAQDNDKIWKLGGGLLSTSIGAKVTGFHAHIRLTDDPLDPFSSYSKAVLESTNKWLDQNYSSRVVEKSQTPHILIMQRVHKLDPSGQELQKMKKGKKIKHICLPGEVLTKTNRALVRPQSLLKFYDGQGGYLDPVRLGKQEIANMETDLGQYGKMAQVDQNPGTPGAGMFKTDNFHIIDQLPLGVKVIQTIRYWDKAGTQDGGAFTAGVKMSMLDNGKFLVMNVKRGQWATELRESLIKGTAQADGNNVTIWIEQEPGSGGKESSESTIRNLAGFPIYAERPTGDKVFRADPYSVQVNNGNVWLLRGDWNQPFIDEHSDFPTGKYKDQVDAGGGAFSKLAGKRFVKVLR